MSSATDTAQTLQGVPEIMALEEKEEERVRSSLAAFAAAEVEEAARLSKEYQDAVAAAQTEADADVAAFTVEEKERIFRDGDAERTRQLHVVDAAHKKNAAAASAALLSRLLDSSFLS